MMIIVSISIDSNNDVGVGKWNHFIYFKQIWFRVGEADDLIPFAKLRFPLPANITWTKTTSNLNIVHTFMKYYCTPHFIKDLHDAVPFDFFNLFISNIMTDTIKFQRNLYAEQHYLRDGKTYKPTDIN